MDGWNITFLLGRPIFRGELLVSGRISPKIWEASWLVMLIFWVISLESLDFVKTEYIQLMKPLIFGAIDLWGKCSSKYCKIFTGNGNHSCDGKPKRA